MDANKRSDMDDKWKKIATLAVTQEEFKEKLTTDPVGVMAKMGLEPPEGVKIRQDTTKVFKLLPPTGMSPTRSEPTIWRF